MIVNPEQGKQYTLTELHIWFSEAQQRNEILIINPCNPMDAEILQTRAIIATRDDLACLTQWLGGLPA